MGTARTREGLCVASPPTLSRPRKGGGDDGLWRLGNRVKGVTCKRTSEIGAGCGVLDGGAKRARIGPEKGAGRYRRGAARPPGEQVLERQCRPGPGRTGGGQSGRRQRGCTGCA